jgi:hypothetical protein
MIERRASRGKLIQIDPEVTDEFVREAMTVVARTTSFHTLSLAATNSS